MGPLDVFLRVSFAGFAAILATVSVQSYARHRERRFLLLTAAFAFFLIQGLWLLVEMATTAVSSIGSGWVGPDPGVLLSPSPAPPRGSGGRQPLTREPPPGLRPPCREPGAGPPPGAACPPHVDGRALP